MGGIFLNYRKGSHTVTVGALADRLDHYFGSGQVFVDNQMKPGTRYPNELYTRLVDSDVLLAVIHDGWTDEFDRPRVKDWVRFEIATALAKHKPVVPVLLEKVDHPQRHELPDDIAEVAVLQAARVRGATFRADVDHLLRLLERYVAPAHLPPPEPPAVTKPKRVGRRIIAWAAGLFFLTPILFFDVATWWEMLAFPAFVSAIVLTLFSIMSMTLIPLTRRLTYRWEIEAGTISLREATSRRWILPAIMLLPFAYFLSRSPTDDGAWAEWEVWYMLVVTVVLLYLLHRTWRRYDAEDRAWPPPVSADPFRFRRAAHKLHEKLTTEPDWRGSRSRAIQREAVSVYLDLAEARLKLRTRATVPLTRWISTGYSAETAACLGWLASIVALDVAALVALTRLDTATTGAYLLIAITVAAALVFTAAKTVTDFYSDRRQVTRWVHELTEWQARVGPLVFC